MLECLPFLLPEIGVARTVDTPDMGMLPFVKCG